MSDFRSGNPVNLSYWEQNQWFGSVDFLVLGAGIVGSSAAFHLRKQFPSAKILLLERGILPSGASTKNAGFACFGSATELLDDLSRISEKEVWETVALRWEGLRYLRELLGDEKIDFQSNGSWDLLTKDKNSLVKETNEKRAYLNENIEQITGEKDCFSWNQAPLNNTGFDQILGGFHNRLEGQIDTGKMMFSWTQLLAENNIHMLTGVDVKAFEKQQDHLVLETTLGKVKTAHLCVCTNGFARTFFPELDVQPARAQVLITKPISNLAWKGTFHYDAGYYYFRNIHNRILLGGGRNLDFKGENTTQMETTQQIQVSLENLLKTVILPHSHVEIESRWAGIMGVGQSKKPIIERVDDRITVGVRMGGMGVAIGTLIGKKVAEISG